MTNRRLSALLLAAVLLILLVSTALLAAAHTDHDCAVADCPVCQTLAAAVCTLKLLLAATLPAVLAAARAARCRTADALVPAAVPRTPVRLKVKLSN